jgi:hypothetical protein
MMTSTTRENPSDAGSIGGATENPPRRRVARFLVVAVLATLGGTAEAFAAAPSLQGTFAMRFTVLEATNVQPGRGATGSRTWIFERENKKLYLLEGLANGGYARVPLKQSTTGYIGTTRLRATCIKHPSVTVTDTSQYSITITRSAIRSGHLVATNVQAYLHDTFGSGCGQAGGSDERRYRGHLVSRN